MDCLGEPTNHHLPRSQPEEYDSSRYDSLAMRANFDEMVMLQKIRGDQKTFAELADSMMSTVLHEAGTTVFLHATHTELNQVI